MFLMKHVNASLQFHVRGKYRFFSQTETLTVINHKI